MQLSKLETQLYVKAPDVSLLGQIFHKKTVHCLPTKTCICSWSWPGFNMLTWNALIRTAEQVSEQMRQIGISNKIKPSYYSLIKSRNNVA